MTMRKTFFAIAPALITLLAIASTYKAALAEQALICVKASNIYSDSELKKPSGAMSEGKQAEVLETEGIAAKILDVPGVESWISRRDLCSPEELERRRTVDETPIQVLSIGVDFLGPFFYQGSRENSINITPTAGQGFWPDKTAEGKEIKIGSNIIVGDGEYVYLLNKKSELVKLPLWRSAKSDLGFKDEKSNRNAWRKKLATVTLMGFLIDEIIQTDAEPDEKNEKEEKKEDGEEKKAAKARLSALWQTSDALQGAISVGDAETAENIFNNAILSANGAETITLIASNYLYLLAQSDNEEMIKGSCKTLLTPTVESSILETFNETEAVFLVSDCYSKRADLHEKNNQCESAIADYSNVLKLNSSIKSVFLKEVAAEINNRIIEAVAGMAWIFATCPDPLFRDGPKSLGYAKKALTLSDTTDFENLPFLHEALAAAQAEKQQFKEAIKSQEKSILLREIKNRQEKNDQGEELLAFHRERLSAYQENIRWRGTAYHSNRLSPWEQIRTGLQLAAEAKVNKSIPYLRKGQDAYAEQNRSGRYQKHPLSAQVLQALPDLIQQMTAFSEKESFYSFEEAQDAYSLIGTQTKMLLSFVETIQARGGRRAKPDIEFALVKGGTFSMGDLFDDGEKNEKPLHKITLSDFYISKYEITQEQWKRTMGSNPSHFIGDDRPVDSVSWNDIQAFLQKINHGSKYVYRLPTEAEWEYAARFGGKKAKWAGNLKKETTLKDYAWFSENSNGETQPVGLKQPNGLGIYDMSGNVSEWVEDWYDENYYSQSSLRNPTGPTTGTAKTIRGGSYEGTPKDLRTTGRKSLLTPDFRFDDLGFRLVREEKQSRRDSDFLGNIK